MASPGKMPEERGDHAGVGAMTPKSTDWNERHLAETPAVELLQSLGYTYVPSEDLNPNARASRNRSSPADSPRPSSG